VNQADFKLLAHYIHTIERKLATGDATEHTHRAALEALVESLAEGITATNEPKHIECGAPDFILRKAQSPLVISRPRTLARAWMRQRRPTSLSVTVIL